MACYNLLVGNFIMKKRNILLLSLSILLASTISSCGNGNVDIEPPITIDTSITSISNAISKLSTSHSFKAGVRVNSEEYEIVFNEDYYINEVSGTGYISSSEGIYPITLDKQGVIQPGELLLDEDDNPITSLYNFDLIDTFALFDVSRLSQEADRNLSITDTSNRYAFLTILGIDSGYITSIQSLTASYTEDINTLMFILNFTNGTRFVTTISEFGEATSETVEAYLDNGGSYYQPSGDFEAVRNAFINHNYTQLVYDASNNVIGHYYFTQRYYAAVYDDTSYATYNDAYFAANNDTLTFLNADGSVYSTLELYGVYNAVISYDSATQSNYIIPIYQRAWNSETDNLPEVMFYPSLASMFSHFSFYTFNEVEQCYYSDDVALALDLYTRFFLNYEEEGYRVELLGSGFNYSKDASGNMDQISLKIFFALNGSDPYYYECVFEDFNETAYEPFEKFMENMTYSLS